MIPAFISGVMATNLKIKEITIGKGPVHIPNQKRATPYPHRKEGNAKSVY